MPLVTDSEGKKFGKSTGGGSLWLDPEMTSPYTWYQYFVNTADADVIRYLRWFTFLDQEELARLEVEVEERPFKREAQRRLAQEMTDLVHGVEAREAVELASQALFGRAELADLDEATLSASLSETDVFEFAPAEETTIVDLLVGEAQLVFVGSAALAAGGVQMVLTPTALAAALASDARPMVLDVRSAGELAMGVVPGAVHLPLDRILDDPAAARAELRAAGALGEAGAPGGLEPVAGDSGPGVVCVCKAGVRAALAADHLRRWGVPGVSVLAGGMLAWREQVDPSLPRY